ncbi:MAG TPA: SWIM zinc finger family protein, partial [Acetobacteraceae bacterium]|nr:SWIM zinc finger family protein [Acetobacteraceae bacterium]
MNMLAPPVPVRRWPTDADIIQMTGRRAFQDGGFYAASGRVRHVVVNDGGDVVEAETKGTAARPYRQHVELRHTPRGAMGIRGTCTCFVGFNCKHVAAVLIAARRLHRPDPAAAAAQASVAAPPEPREPPLRPDLEAWLHALGRTEQSESEDYPDQQRQRVVYVLDLGANPRGEVDVLDIRPHSATLRKTGVLSAEHPLAADRWSGNQRPAYLRPSDRLILNRLALRRTGSPTPEDDPADTLRRIIATGRARWGHVNGPPVTEGPTRAGRLGWRMMDDGSQVPAIELEPAARPMRIPAPWYIEPESGLLGPLTLDLPERLAARLLAAPPILAMQANRMRAELTRRVGGADIPPPAELPEPELLQVPPVPLLRLLVGPARHSIYEHTPPAPTARLAFRYGPATTAPGKALDVVYRAGRLYHVVQDRAAEHAAAAELHRLGLQRLADTVRFAWGLTNPDDLVLPGDQAANWLDVMITGLPRLRRAGWTIEVDPDFPWQIVEAAGDITAELEEGSGIDWLELHLGVIVDGERLDLVPGLVKLIAAAPGPGFATALDAAPDDAPFAVPLPDGRLLSVPLGRI